MTVKIGSIMKLYFLGLAFLFAGIQMATAQDIGPTPLFGVMCYTEEASVKIAAAYEEGGLDLQDEVVDHLINVENACVRIPEDSYLLGYVVYEGPVIGTSQVLGVAPNQEGPAQLYGVVTIPSPVLAPKRGA
jgi:hypothetical protein